MNAMEFEKDLSGSMMHVFGYLCILYRKRFSFYFNFTFLHNFNGHGLCSAKCMRYFGWLVFVEVLGPVKCIGQGAQFEDTA